MDSNTREIMVYNEHKMIINHKLFIFRLLVCIFIVITSQLCYYIGHNIFMYYYSPYNTHQPLLHLQSQLIDTFHHHQLPDFYQNIFINHIKYQQSIQAQLIIQQEIQSLQNLTAHIQSFIKYSQQKHKYQRYITQLVNYTKQSQNAKLIKICELVGYLRDTNYKCAYFLLKIREKYEHQVDICRSIEKYYFNSFAIKLDSFRKQLLKTDIGKYIEFQPQYDPFFMNLRQKQYHSDKRCNQAIQILMLFSVQDSYKCLKMNKILIDWIYMHSRRRVLDKKLDIIDVPELSQKQQQYVQYDKLKIELFRDKIKADNFEGNNKDVLRSRNIMHVYNHELRKSRNMDYLQPNEVISLEELDKQRLRRHKQKQRKVFLNQNLSNLLDNSAQKGGRSHLRTKSQASPYNVYNIEKIRKFTISNKKNIQNSPNYYQDKRSETRTILPKDDKQSSSLSKKYSRIQAKQDYDRKYDYREQRKRDISHNKIKLQKISAYQITIGKQSNHSKSNRVAENTPTVRKSTNETSKHRTIDRTISKQQQNNQLAGLEMNQYLEKKSNVSSRVEDKSYKTNNMAPQITNKNTESIQPQQIQKIAPQKQQLIESKPITKKQQSIKFKQQQKKQEQRQIKMRVGKFTLQNFKQYFNKYKIHKDYANLYDKEKITKQLQFQQSYVSQFFINGQPGTLAIIYLLANNNLLLRLWALQQKQEITLSYPLLKKFLEYVQKSTTNQILFYKGGQFPELMKVGFIKKKEQLFVRKRITQTKEVDFQFQQCFSIRNSQIQFVQKQKEDILVSPEIQNFTLQNSNMAQCLMSMNDQQLPQKLNNLISIKHKIDGFKSLNKLLQKQEFDTYQVKPKINVQSIELCMFNFLSEFGDCFIAAQGYIKFYGNFVKQSQKQTICSIKLKRNNGKIYFCKGYKTAQQVQKDLKLQTQKKVQFWVAMFNKKLYGRFKNYKNTANQVCYASWNFSIFWQDEIRGALRYNKRTDLTFQKSQFFVCIQLQGSLLYTFEVNEEDYIF